jgi:hypothetical protein
LRKAQSSLFKMGRFGLLTFNPELPKISNCASAV